MLRCIRCGACMNHCPVYQSIGGHAYGWVYPGPMGSVPTSLYTGLENSLDLPHAATLCNQCGVVCPVRIPLPELLRNCARKTDRAWPPAMAGTTGALDVGLDRAASWSLCAGNENRRPLPQLAGGGEDRIKVLRPRAGPVDGGT